MTKERKKERISDKSFFTSLVTQEFWTIFGQRSEVQKFKVFKSQPFMKNILNTNH